jgi:hypothetical protein
VKTAAYVVMLVLFGAEVPRVAQAQAMRPASSATSRIRLERNGARPVTAKLVQRYDNSIDVQWPDGRRETIPLYEVGKIELSEGRRHAPIRGAVYGSIVGLGVGLLLRSRQRDDYEPGSPVNNNLMPVSIVAGTAVGTLVGTLGSERWRTIYSAAPAEHVGLGTAITPKRFAIAVARSF